MQPEPSENKLKSIGLKFLPVVLFSIFYYQLYFGSGYQSRPDIPLYDLLDKVVNIYPIFWVVVITIFLFLSNKIKEISGNSLIKVLIYLLVYSAPLLLVIQLIKNNLAMLFGYSFEDGFAFIGILLSPIAISALSFICNFIIRNFVNIEDNKALRDSFLILGGVPILLIILYVISAIIALSNYWILGNKN